MLNVMASNPYILAADRSDPSADRSDLEGGSRGKGEIRDEEGREETLGTKRRGARKKTTKKWRGGIISTSMVDDAQDWVDVCGEQRVLVNGRNRARIVTFGPKWVQGNPIRSTLSGPIKLGLTGSLAHKTLQLV